MLAVFISALLFLILVITIDPFAGANAIYYLVPFAALIGSSLYFSSTPFGKSVLDIMTALLLFIIVTYYLTQRTAVLKWMRPVYIPALILITAVMIAPMLQTWAKRQSGGVEFFINFILFVPCLLRDAFEWTMNEVSITTPNTWRLFLIAASISGTALIGPIVYTRLQKWWYNDFLWRPIFMFGSASRPDGKQIAGTGHFIEHPKTNYSVEFEVYQNEDRAGGQTHTVLNYGSRPHAQIKNNQLMLSHGTNGTNKTIVSIPLQKWVHVVCVYSKNVCNVFIDGEFVKTADLSSEPFEFTPEIWLGDEEVFGNGGIRMIRAVPYA